MVLFSNSFLPPSIAYGSTAGQDPALPQDPVTDLRTDKQSYQSGEYVTVTGNLGENMAALVMGNDDGGGGDDDGSDGGSSSRSSSSSSIYTAQFRVHEQEPPGEFILMDNLYNVTESGDFTYTFQIKGIGTLESGTYAVLVFSPNGKSAQTTFEYTYNREAALQANPMTVDWEENQTRYHNLDVFDMIYGEDPLDAASQRLEYSFSREIKYMVIPDESATITSMRANHLKLGNSSFPISASLDIRLDAQRNGTLVLDIPIDIVEPNQIKLRGYEARDGSAPFEVSSNAGNPTSTRLLYYNEVQHIIAIDYTPEHRSFLIRSDTASPIADPSLLEEYAIPEFEYAFIVMAAGVIAAIALLRIRSQKQS